MSARNSGIPLLVGPTAVGKTEVGIVLAKLLGGEIVSADGRQIYRGLDIGTAKPSMSERNGIVHHFIDELDIGEPFSAGAFARAAEERMRDIVSRGATPVVVGGSTLYVEALIRGFADVPEIDASVRRRLQRRLASEGSAALYGELLEVDPLSAARLDPSKSQRIVRALEVYLGTGEPLSSFHRHHVRPSFAYNGVVMARDRVRLYDRINRRVDRMLETGLVEEVEAILKRDIDPNDNALRTIGYREVVGYLAGTYEKKEMVRLLKRNTRRYAKRQITWFKRYSHFMHVNLDTQQTSRILEALRP